RRHTRSKRDWSSDVCSSDLTPKRCWVSTANGRLVFDVNTDVGVAHDVPAEAHRRFRADLRGHREQNLKTRAEQLALHEEKKAFKIGRASVRERGWLVGVELC